MVENVLYWPSQGCCVTLVSKAEWNVALCLCYHGLLKPSLWNHLGSSCLLLHQNFVCEILSYSGISLWLGQRKTQTKQAKLILFFFFLKKVQIWYSVMQNQTADLSSWGWDACVQINMFQWRTIQSVQEATFPGKPECNFVHIKISNARGSLLGTLKPWLFIIKQRKIVCRYCYTVESF